MAKTLAIVLACCLAFAAVASAHSEFLAGLSSIDSIVMVLCDMLRSDHAAMPVAYQLVSNTVGLLHRIDSWPAGCNL